MDPDTEFLNELPDTEWSLLESVGRDEFGAPSWEKDYSLPVHDFLRILGHREDEALELSQKFFANLFSGDQSEDELSGPFRLYLKQALLRFRPSQSQPNLQKAEQAFDRAWLLSLMQKTLDSLQEKMTASGEEHLFTLLAPILDGRQSSVPKSELAAQLKLSLADLSTTILKMRQRYRHLLEQELRQSVTTQEELEGEVRHLQSIWN